MILNINKNNFNIYLKKSIKAKISLKKKIKQIQTIINNISEKVLNGGKIFLCGNGGSAGDAQHLAAEFLVRMRKGVNRNPIPAVSLIQDTSTLTACANDYSFDQIFVRNLQALANPKDVLIVISTSGNSRNIVKVAQYAKKNKIYTVGFLGSNGGIVKLLCKDFVIINSNETSIIQESHIFLGHFIFTEIEKNLIKKNFLKIE